ncbi:MAG: hypothetical protein Q9213_004004 [Squamulea squamosa]
MSSNSESQPDKPRPMRQYNKQFQLHYDNQQLHLDSLNTRLATLYNERRTLFASLSRLPPIYRPPDIPAADSSNNNDPPFVIKNRPMVTISEIDMEPDGLARIARTHDEIDKRNGVRVMRALKINIANVEAEIAELERGNEYAKLQLRGAAYREEIKRNKQARMTNVIDLENLEIGEDAKAASQDKDSVLPSVERDEYADIENAEKERLELSCPESEMREYIKDIEDRMAKGVENAVLRRMVNEMSEELDEGAGKGKATEQSLESRDLKTTQTLLSNWDGNWREHSIDSWDRTRSQHAQEMGFTLEQYEEIAGADDEAVEDMDTSSEDLEEERKKYSEALGITRGEYIDLEDAAVDFAMEEEMPLEDPDEKKRQHAKEMGLSLDEYKVMENSGEGIGGFEGKMAPFNDPDEEKRQHAKEMGVSLAEYKAMENSRGNKKFADKSEEQKRQHAEELGVSLEEYKSWEE